MVRIPHQTLIGYFPPVRNRFNGDVVLVFFLSIVAGVCVEAILAGMGVVGSVWAVIIACVVAFALCSLGIRAFQSLALQDIFFIVTLAEVFSGEEDLDEAGRKLWEASDIPKK